MSPSLIDLKAGRSFLSRNFLMSINTNEKRIALTFDDGPNPRNTPKLLDLLASKEIPATFFLVGRNIRRYPEIAREIFAAGHDLGNHTFHHVPLPLLPGRLVCRELKKTSEAIAGITGSNPRFVRPPMGWFTNRILEIFRERTLYPVLGNIYPRDSIRPGVETIVQRVLERVEPGSIVILHDGGWRAGVDRGQTIEAVDRITDQLGVMGYGFDLLGDLLARSIVGRK